MPVMCPEHEDEVKSLTLIDRLELGGDSMDYMAHTSVVCRQISYHITRFPNLRVKLWIKSYMSITLRCRCTSRVNCVKAITDENVS